MLFGRVRTPTSRWCRRCRSSGSTSDGVGPFDLALRVPRVQHGPARCSAAASTRSTRGSRARRSDGDAPVRWSSARQSIKFYQAQSPRACVEGRRPRRSPTRSARRRRSSGIKMVQFHKGLPLGRQRVEDLAPERHPDSRPSTSRTSNFGPPPPGSVRTSTRRIDIASRFEQRLPDPAAGLQPVLRAAAGDAAPARQGAASTAARIGSATAPTASCGRTSRRTSTSIAELRDADGASRRGTATRRSRDETRDEDPRARTSRAARASTSGPTGRVPEGERAVAR